MKYIYLVLLLVAPALYAELTVAPVFGNSMVLQRNQEIPVWGTAAPNQNVTVQLGDERVQTRAEADGSWMAKLPARASGRDLTLTINAGMESAAFTNVVMGEVWVCSGQSNMEFSLGNSNQGKEAVAAADYPEMRLFMVEKNAAMTPQKTLKGQWEVCTPETANIFSAVGFYFGRELYQKLDVPVGLIDSSWGGTPCRGVDPDGNTQSQSERSADS